MKKVILTTFLLCIVLSFLSCSKMNDNSSQESNEDRFSDGESMSTEEKQMIENMNSQTEAALNKETDDNYKNKITASYSEKDFFGSVLYQFYSPLASFHYYLYSVEDLFPAECIRRTSDNTLYSMYRTTEGGLVYLYFEKIYSQWVLHHSVYVKKSLEQSDFQDLRLGDTIEDVEKIDPVAGVVKKYTTFPWTVHLLRDGIIKITYTINDNGIYIISEIQRDDNFELNLDNVVHDYTILPQDYIQ